MEVAVFSVIFEANLKYLDDFISSLNKQNFKSFELFLINDGISTALLNNKLNKANFPFFVYSIRDVLSPVKIREVGFRELTNRNYNKIIFADTDDYMSSNRIGRSIEMLDTFPIVFNDLTLVDQNCYIIKSSIWKDRLLGTIIDRDFLIDKNVLGLGNSAIRGSYLQNIEFSENIIALDWYLFSIILDDMQAGFISDAVTFYRQHTNNTIGLKNISKSRLEIIFNVKIHHYKEMAHIDSIYLKILEEIQLKNKLLTEDSKAVEEVIKSKLNFFWWEETNFIKI